MIMFNIFIIYNRFFKGYGQISFMFMCYWLNIPDLIAAFSMASGSSGTGRSSVRISWIPLWPLNAVLTVVSVGVHSSFWDCDPGQFYTRKHLVFAFTYYMASTTPDLSYALGLKSWGTHVRSGPVGAGCCLLLHWQLWNERSEFSLSWILSWTSVGREGNSLGLDLNPITKSVVLATNNAITELSKSFVLFPSISTHINRGKMVEQWPRIGSEMEFCMCMLLY